MAEHRSFPEPTPLEPDDPGYLAERYHRLRTTGVSISSDRRADVSIGGSALEGWGIAAVLLLASCLAMGIYLVVLHH